MNLEPIIQSEVSQKEKAYIVYYRIDIQKDDTEEAIESIFLKQTTSNTPDHFRLLLSDTWVSREGAT